MASEMEVWAEQWDADGADWHTSSAEPNDDLVEVYDKLVVNAGEGRFFLPLCGKSGDLFWLSHVKGHRVVGVEFVDKVAKECFEENKIKYQRSAIESCTGHKYESLDGKVVIYVTDLFKITPELLGPVDYVLDRGSIIAIEPADRPKYMNLMRELWRVQPFRYYGVICVYDLSERPSLPPYSIPLEDVKKLFDFTEVEWSEMTEPPAIWKVLGLSTLKILLCILKRKTD